MLVHKCICMDLEWRNCEAWFLEKTNLYLLSTWVKCRLLVYNLNALTNYNCFLVCACAWTGPCKRCSTHQLTRCVSIRLFGVVNREVDDSSE
jgi:hypothetical protein